MRSTLLIIDAVINIVLGTFLVASPLRLFQLLGLPLEVPSFYATILGGVLMGIGIALLMGLSPERAPGRWLGLGGAMVINLFGALTLSVLLVSGRIFTPLRGYLILWALVFLFVIIGLLEWWISGKTERGSK
jgi:hypothetical protein